MKKIFLLISIILLTFSSNLFAQGPPPTNLVSSNLTQSTVDLSWLDNGCTSTVIVKYKESASSTWLTATNTATSPYTLTGLIGGTNYDWRLKCFGCNGSSCWSTTAQFTSLAPTIDTAFISAPILCHGEYTTDSIQVNITQSSPPSSYTCVIGYYFILNGNTTTSFISYYSTDESFANQQYFNNFQPNIDYVVRIVDSTAYYNANTNGNGNSTVGIYDEFGPLNFYNPPPLVATTTEISSNLCYGDCIAEEQIEISGGTQPYNYILDMNQVFLSAGSSTDTLSNLCAGIYNLEVSDTNGCVASPNMIAINIDSISPITPAYQVSQYNLGTNGNISCFGGNDGFIVIIDTALGGTGSFIYSIDSVNFQTSTDFYNLTAGTYSLTFQDGNGCTATDSIILNEPPPLAATAGVTDPIDCYGETGEITITYDPNQPGTPGYLYSADNINFQTSNVFSLFGDSTYDMTIEDINGCQFTVPVYLSQPTAVTIDSIIKVDITCNNLNNGTATVVNPNGGMPSPLGQPYTYLWDDPLGQTTQTATGLAEGTYTCKITDAVGCFFISDTITIVNPTPITAFDLTNSVSCFGGNNGEATVNVSGGVPFLNGDPYTYLWDDVLAQTTQTASGLSAGGYTCTITDFNGCSLTTPTITITESSQISTTISRTNITCHGLVDGTAIVTASGGNPFILGNSYTYLWDDPLGQTTQTATGLIAGTYTCVITDSLNCDVISSVTITEPPLISASVTNIDITCNGLLDGSATVNASGGRPFTVGDPYTYSWDDPFGQLTQTITGLSAGIYACIITDSSGCFFIADSIIITEPGLLEIDSIHYINESCYGANDGEILAIDILGGVPPFEYSVNGSTHYSNMAYFNGYDAGTYTVEVFDSNNCVSGNDIIITEPDELIVDITTSGWVFNNNSGLYSYQIKCHGDNSGFANLTITGGTAPFIKNVYDDAGIQISPNTSAALISDLIAGEYIFEVIDAQGCTYSETILFSEPDPIQHDFIATHVTCSGWNNGSLTDIVSGGVGNPSSYSYLWSTGDTTYNIDGLAVGIYNITVIDENNCVSSASEAINDINALIVNTSFQDISCYDYCDGEATATPIGGIPNYDVNGNAIYTYQWNDILSQTTSTALGLCADNNSNLVEYSCIVMDGQGCADTVHITLNQPDSLYVSATITSEYNLQDISCYGGDDGKLKATSIGGIPPYSYYWSNGETTQNVDNLSAGTYNVVVEDAEGCLDTTEIILTEPAELTISISQVNVNCFGIYDGTITADANGGTPFPGIPPMYNYNFSSGFNEQIDISTDIEVMPGIYTVTATDNNGCSVISESIFISQPSDILTIDLDSIDESCNASNGEITSNVSGGTNPYTYIWSNGENTSSIDDLSPGFYTIIIRDFNDCMVYDTIRVNGSNEIFLPGNISSFDTTICLGSDFPLNIEEKLGFNYIWEYNNEILLNKSINNLTNDHADIIVTPIDYINIYTLNISDPSCSTSYEVTATVNVNFIDPMPISDPGIEYGNFPILLAGDDLTLSAENNTCIEYTWQWSNDTISNNSGSITIAEVERTDWYYLYVKDSEGCLGFDSIYVVVGVKPYEAITPNNDGFNDSWTPLDIQSYENGLVQVFNRWGGLVFESEGGENYQAWDGTNSGKDLPAGTYYYIIDLNTGDEPQTGPITIIR